MKGTALPLLEPVNIHGWLLQLINRAKSSIVDKKK